MRVDVLEYADRHTKINNTKELYSYLESKYPGVCWLVANMVNVGPNNASLLSKPGQSPVFLTSEEHPNIGHNLLVSEIAKRSDEQTESMKKCLGQLFDSLLPLGFHIFIDIRAFERRIYNSCRAEKIMIGWVKSGDVELDITTCGGEDKQEYFMRRIEHTFGRLGWLIF